MIDSQAVKTIEQGARYDAGQKIKARKGHLLVDRLGLIEAYQSKLRTDQIRWCQMGATKSSCYGHWINIDRGRGWIWG